MPNSITEYFRTSKEELEKVSWPSREATIRYGTLIIVGSVLAALFFGALDFGLSRLVQVTIGSRAQTTNTPPTSEPPTTEPTTAVEVAPGTLEATDASGNKVNLDVKALPVNPVDGAPAKN